MAKRKQTTTYNRILKDFTKLNSKLPEDKKKQSYHAIKMFQHIRLRLRNSNQNLQEFMIRYLLKRYATLTI
jgi:hypothetical protein